MFLRSIGFGISVYSGHSDWNNNWYKSSRKYAQSVRILRCARSKRNEDDPSVGEYAFYGSQDQLLFIFAVQGGWVDQERNGRFTF